MRPLRGGVTGQALLKQAAELREAKQIRRSPAVSGVSNVSLTAVVTQNRLTHSPAIPRPGSPRGRSSSTSAQVSSTQYGCLFDEKPKFVVMA